MSTEDPAQIAAQIKAALDDRPERNTPAAREVRRAYTRQLKSAAPDFVIAVAHALLEQSTLRWVAFELIAAHKPAFLSLTGETLEHLGQGINSWWTVDAFARTLTGPAWLAGLVPDELILGWAQSPDFWWRRAALVSTVALNTRSQGGSGDPARTLGVCRLLVADREDMVVKALSWALRALVGPAPDAVRTFLEEHEIGLAARVIREVQNKLTTGLKNPRHQAIDPPMTAGIITPDSKISGDVHE